MSINLKNPKTPLEKADAIANLIEQMQLAHTTRDEKRFVQAKEKAADLASELVNELMESE